MFRKLINYLYHFWTKEPPLLPPHYAEEPIAKSIFRDIVYEVARKKYFFDDQALSGKVLSKAFRKTLRYALSHNDGCVAYYDIGIKNNMFYTYGDICIKACKELGINVTWSGNYLQFNSANLEQAMKNIGVPQVNIDEKTKLLLSTGVYR